MNDGQRSKGKRERHEAAAQRATLPAGVICHIRKGKPSEYQLTKPAHHILGQNIVRRQWNQDCMPYWGRDQPAEMLQLPI